MNVSEAVRQIIGLHAQNGGSTFNLFEGDLAGRRRYAVSLYPERSRLVKGAELSPEVVEVFIRDNLDLLRDVRNSVGTWYNAEQDITYLDVSATLDDLELALEAAKVYNQIAIFDLSHLEEVATGGTGESVADLPPEVERLRGLLEGRKKGR